MADQQYSGNEIANILRTVEKLVEPIRSKQQVFNTRVPKEIDHREFAEKIADEWTKIKSSQESR